MNILQQHIISRLKQQPKQGFPKEDDPADIKKEEDRRKQANIDLTKTLTGLFDITKDLAGENIALSTGIEKLIAVQQSYAAKLKTQTDLALILEKRNHGLQKSYALNVQAAAEFGFQLDQQSQKLNISRENLEKYIGGLNGLTSGYIASSKAGSAQVEQMVLQQRYFTDMIGVTDEAAEGLQAFAASSGLKGNEIIGSLSAQAKYIEEITGLKGVERDIEEQIGSLSAEAQQQFSRMPSTLGLAVMKMKALGLNMEQLTKTGDSLLNIEESVGNEMNLQLLTGTRLIKDGKSITNEYRKQYLAGNAEGMAQSLNDAYQTQKKSLATNMLARKEYEKLFGLEEGAVAKMIQKEEIINSLRTDDKTKGELLGLDPAALEKRIQELKDKGSLDINAGELEKLMNTVDNRKTEDKQTELLSQMYTKGILVHQTSKEAAGKTAANISADVLAVTTKLGTAMDGINNFSLVYAEQLGAIKQFSGGMEGFKSATTAFVEGLPALLGTGVAGAKLALTAMTELYDGIKKLPIIGDIVNSAADFATGTAMGDFVPPTSGDGLEPIVTKVPDGVMMHDGVVNFNPRDKFTRVNDGMTVAGTNVGGIDRFAAQMEKRDAKFEQTMTRLISQMASQTKAALESANIQITPDRTFSSNSLNKGIYA
jgi:biotin operon repressor